MGVISRQRWRITLLSVVTLSALFFSLAFVGASPVHGAGQLTQISSDPYTNPDSNHKTQVEPDTFAFGNTIEKAARLEGGHDGVANIGFATSTNAGETWTHGFIP